MKSQVLNGATSGSAATAVIEPMQRRRGRQGHRRNRCWPRPHDG